MCFEVADYLLQGNYESLIKCLFINLINIRVSLEQISAVLYNNSIVLYNINFFLFNAHIQMDLYVE